MSDPVSVSEPSAAVEEVTRIVLPEPAVLFGQRALRLRQLAQGHAMGGFLALMADVAQAQHEVCGLRGAAALDLGAVEQSCAHRMPPLSALAHDRAPVWQEDLRDLAERLSACTAAGPLVEALAKMDVPAREALADRVLAGHTLDEDAAAAPLVGAALQLHFTRLAATLSLPALQHVDAPGLCPVCASRPMASVVRVGAGRDHLRYLACSLCGTEWNLARILCSACQSEKSVAYLGRDHGVSRDDASGEAPLGAVTTAHRAETCDSCHSYLKIFYQEHDAQVEPLADDLATLALDLAVCERGYARSGPNLLWHPGEA